MKVKKKSKKADLYGRKWRRSKDYLDEDERGVKNLA